MAVYHKCCAQFPTLMCESHGWHFGRFWLTKPIVLGFTGETLCTYEFSCWNATSPQWNQDKANLPAKFQCHVLSGWNLKLCDNLLKYISRILFGWFELWNDWYLDHPHYQTWSKWGRNLPLPRGWLSKNILPKTPKKFKCILHDHRSSVWMVIMWSMQTFFPLQKVIQ